jgi:fungal STAND N-terminal Goodbye domain
MSQFAASWAEARHRYTDVVGLDLEDAQFPHPSSVDELLGVIEERSESFADFRSRKGKLFHALFEISKPISIIASVAGDEAQTAFPPATVCLGAVSHLINAAKGVSSAYDNIMDLLEQLKVVCS